MGRQLKVLLLVGSLVPTASWFDDDGDGQKEWKLKLYEKGSGCAGEAYLGKVIRGPGSGCEDVPLADERAVHFTECTLEHATLSVYSTTGCPTDAALEERTVPISNYDEGSECVEGLFDDLDAIIMCPSAYYGVTCNASAGVTFVPIDESDCNDAYLEGIVNNVLRFTNVLRGHVDTSGLIGCGKRAAGCGEICEASGECGIANIGNCEIDGRPRHIYRKVCDPNATVPTLDEIIAGISPNDDATIPSTFEGVTLPPAFEPSLGGVFDAVLKNVCADKNTAVGVCHIAEGHCDHINLNTDTWKCDDVLETGLSSQFLTYPVEADATETCEDLQETMYDCGEEPYPCQTEHRALVKCTFELGTRIYYGHECEFSCPDTAETPETAGELGSAADGARKTTAVGALLGTALLL